MDPSLFLEELGQVLLKTSQMHTQSHPYITPTT